MSQKPINTVDAEHVQRISVTESHYGNHPANNESVISATINDNVLVLRIGDSEAAEQTPLAEVDLKQVLAVQLLDAQSEPITSPQYLLGVDSVQHSHLHIFTDIGIE